MNKPIANCSNYLIDEDGQIFNTTTQKYLKGSVGKDGYRYYKLSINGEKKKFYAHHLVAQAFLPNPNNLSAVNHKDGNKLNNNVENLEWVVCLDTEQNGIIKQTISFFVDDLLGIACEKFFNYIFLMKTNFFGKVKSSLLYGYSQIKQVLISFINNIINFLKTIIARF